MKTSHVRVRIKVWRITKIIGNARHKSVAIMIEKWVNFKRDYLEISFLRENCGYDATVRMTADADWLLWHGTGWSSSIFSSFGTIWLLSVPQPKKILIGKQYLTDDEVISKGGGTGGGGGGRGGTLCPPPKKKSNTQKVPFFLSEKCPSSK